jgi:hypothetical protein
MTIIFMPPAGFRVTSSNGRTVWPGASLKSKRRTISARARLAS